MEKVLIFGMLILMIPCLGQTDNIKSNDHRDDFKMNSISGGEFRNYITKHIQEDDLWALSIRKFGTFHNLMHEWMSDLARFGKENDPDNAVEIDKRISGGQWTEYRKNLEAANKTGHWPELVQEVEIMHDRVHQAMVYAIKYDNQKYKRNIDVATYAGPERMPHDVLKTIPDRVGEKATFDRNKFREFVWHKDFENPHMHTALQQILVFEEMLEDLINLWALEATAIGNENCRLEIHKNRYTGDDLDKFITQLENCNNEEWQVFIKSVSLMQDRIHKAMGRIMSYVSS